MSVCLKFFGKWVFRYMSNTRIPWGRLLLAFLIIFILLISTRMKNHPSSSPDSVVFFTSVTLGQSETSFNPLLSEIIVLYLRNKGIQVKELTFKDPTRLPSALENKIIDTYWEVQNPSPSDEDQLMRKDNSRNHSSYLFVPRIHASKKELLEPHFNNIMERLTMDKWAELRNQVDIFGEDVSQVAKQFLIEEHLIR